MNAHLLKLHAGGALGDFPRPPEGGDGAGEFVQPHSGKETADCADCADDETVWGKHRRHPDGEGTTDCAAFHIRGICDIRGDHSRL